MKKRIGNLRLVFRGIIVIAIALLFYLIMSIIIDNRINEGRMDTRGAIKNQVNEQNEELLNERQLNEKQRNEKNLNNEHLNEANLYSEDDGIYVKSIQNINSSNCIVYENGFYYYRSQKDYSLYRMGEDGKSQQKLSDEIPSSIYVQDNRVYFNNISDKNKLYTVGIDGTNLSKVNDISIHHMMVVNNKVYFYSLKDYDNDNRYPSLETIHSYYLYSMNLDGTDIKLLFQEPIDDFTTDGDQLFYVKVKNETKDDRESQYSYLLCSSNMDGTNEKVLMYKGLSNLINYKDNLYYFRGKSIYRMDEAGLKEELIEDNEEIERRFYISNNILYTFCNEKLYALDLNTGKKWMVCEDKYKINGDIYDSTTRRYGFSIVNHKMFFAYWESAEKGILLNIYDQGSSEFQVFEDIDKIKKEDLISWVNPSEQYGSYLEDRNKSLDKYLADDLIYKDNYSKTKDGTPYGTYFVSFPQFNENIKGYKKINEHIKKLFYERIEEKDELYVQYKIAEQESGSIDPFYNRIFNMNLSEGYIYISDKYVSINFYKYIQTEYRYRMIDWVTMTFDKDSGEHLQIQEMFQVDKRRYKREIVKIIYKYFELENQYVRIDELLFYLKDNHFFFNENGLIVGYDVNTVSANCAGDQRFEIPYSNLKDILDFK